MESFTAVRDPLAPMGMPWLKPAAMLGRAERQHLLIRVHGFAMFRGEGACSEDCVGEADQEDGARRKDERGQGRRVHFRSTELGEPGGDWTGQVDSVRGQVKCPRCEHPQHDDDERARKPGCETLDTDQQHQAHDRHTNGPRVRITKVQDDVDGLLDVAFHITADSGQLGQLPQSHEKGDARDVPHQDRLREVVGDPAQAQQASPNEHKPYRDREGGGQCGVLRGTRGGEWCQGGRYEQCHGPLGTDDASSGGPEPRVDQNGKQQRVQARGDRETCEFRVGHA